jgi:hypothetical protein
LKKEERKKKVFKFKTLGLLKCELNLDDLVGFCSAAGCKKIGLFFVLGGGANKKEKKKKKKKKKGFTCAF